MSDLRVSNRRWIVVLKVAVGAIAAVALVLFLVALAEGRPSLIVIGLALIAGCIPLLYLARHLQGHPTSGNRTSSGQ